MCRMEMQAAVEELHAREVSHRDLKPKNVLQGADGSLAIISFKRAVISDSYAEKYCDIDAMVDEFS